MARLPALLIPDELSDLIKALATRDHSGGVSAAVRELLKESPRLVALAQERGIDLATLNVRAHGGKRTWLQVERAKVEAIQLAHEFGAIGKIDLARTSEEGFEMTLVMAKPENVEMLQRALTRLLNLEPELQSTLPTAEGYSATIDIAVPADWVRPVPEPSQS